MNSFQQPCGAGLITYGSGTSGIMDRRYCQTEILPMEQILELMQYIRALDYNHNSGPISHGKSQGRFQFSFDLYNLTHKWIE